MHYGNIAKGVFNPPQSKPGFKRPDMVKNDAGGYVFSADMWTRLTRFLILGSDSGSYYATPRDLTKQNIDNIVTCIEVDGLRVVQECIRVSHEGLAPKNDAAVFVMALCSALGDNQTKASVMTNLNRVCRISTHLMLFANYCDAIRGWGRGLRNGIANWYNSTPVEKLAYQVTKYPSRNNWSHRDLLRKAHPVTNSPVKNELYNYITQGTLPAADELSIIRACHEIKQPEVTIAQACKIIVDNKLTFEMIPTQMLKSPEVWEALLPTMGTTAMMRNLGRMSSIGLIAPNSAATKLVHDRLTDEDILSKARIHPINVLIAYKTYTQGHGDRGSLNWTTVAKIEKALDEAFLKSFKYIEPTNKRFSLSFDISGSMWWGKCVGLSNFYAAEASGALGLCIVTSEPDVETYAFDTKYKSMPLTNKTSIKGALNAINNHNTFGGTDCALPMVHAMKNKIPFDVFMVFTDSETWAGSVHPYQALLNYRKAMGIDARLIVCAMSSNGFSIADPKDNGMLDVVGFDASLPTVVSNFAMGNF